MSALPPVHDGFGFDAVDPIHMRASGSAKWTYFAEDVIPAWVADMDYPTAPCVLDAVRDSVDTRVHGYASLDVAMELRAEFCAWTQARTGLGADPSLVQLCDDVVQALMVSVTAFTDPGDGVVVLTPVYPPFTKVVAESGRRLVEHRMRPDANGKWVFDPAELREQCERERPRMVMFCQPHNPVGRVWSRAELTVVAEIAENLDLVVLSDEIHSEIVFDGRRCDAFASVVTRSGASTRARTVTVTSANKTFNIAGLKAAEIVFGSKALKDRFAERVHPWLLGQPSALALRAHTAAYRCGGPWLSAVLDYLQQNRDAFVDRLGALAPSVVASVPEATYLVWIDFSAVPGVAGGRPVASQLLDDVKLGLSRGEDFVEGGESCVRVNLATSRRIVVDIAERIGRFVAARHADDADT